MYNLREKKMFNRMKLPAAALMACLAAGAASAQEKVVIYQWFEYIPQELLAKFTEETGIEVVMDTYDSNESLLASLKAGSLGTYDVAFPGNYMVSIMAKEGILQEIDTGELKNRGNIKEKWSDPSFDPGLKYSIPYQWGSTSLAVNTDVYSGDINTSDILFHPPEELKGKINMFDSQSEVMVMAAMNMGIPQCTNDREQLKALNDMLQQAKKDWVSFNSDTAREAMVAGDYAASMMYDGWTAKARAEGAPVKYGFPREGYIVWMDTVVLLKDSPNRDNALIFMDFLLEPENIAMVSNFALYGNGIKGSEEFMNKELVDLPEFNPPEEAGEPVFVLDCDEETQKVYDQIWTNLKK